MSPRRTHDPGFRVALVVWIAVLVVTAAPYVIASLRPPAGRGFTGAFFFQDDYLQYLSFAEQASRGAPLFYNKFDVSPQGPFLVNLEWWAAGLFGALLGGRPAAGFHAVAVLASAGLVFGAERLLALAGLSRARLAWGLVLVTTGTGFGWLRVWLGKPLEDIPDILRCIYPWDLLLLYPHGATGCALLLWAIAFHLESRAGSGPRWPWIATASAIGLTRPFDLATFLLVAGLLLGLDLLRAAERRRSLRRGADLLWLVPVLFYDALAFWWHPSFALWSTQNVVARPPLVEFAWALAPAMVLAAAGARSQPSEPPGSGEVRRALLIWFLALSGLLASPLSFVQQLGTSLGAAILLLAAIHTPRRWLPAAALALSPTALFLLWKLLHPPPEWFPPRDYLTAAEHLKGSCLPGDIAMAPIDPSLFIAGLTPCSVVLGHRVLTPRFESRIEEARRFYDPATDPGSRLRYLGGIGARFVLLPAGRGAWLGPGPPYVARLRLPLLEVWEAER